jgi:MFS family permease
MFFEGSRDKSPMLDVIKKPHLLRIYILPLATMITGSMVGAISILYALELGADIFQVNLITTIRTTMGIVLLVPFGILSDRIGRRPMVLFSRLVIALGTLIRAFAAQPDHLIIASFAGGFAGGGFFPIILSMIGDVTEREERQEAISTMWVFSSVGMLLGPIICSSLLFLPQISLRTIYQIALVAQVAVFIYLATQIRETRPKGPDDIRFGDYRPYISELIRQPIFQSLLATALLYFFSRSVIATYIPIHARINLGLSNAEVASFSAYRNLAVMLIRFSSATFLTGIPIAPFLVSVVVLGGIAGLMSPFANDYTSIVSVIFFSGVSYGAVRILTSVLVADNSTPKNRGVANSVFQLAMGTGRITNIFTTPIVETLGYAPTFILGGTIGLVAALPILRSRAHLQGD